MAEKTLEEILVSFRSLVGQYVAHIRNKATIALREQTIAKHKTVDLKEIQEIDKSLDKLVEVFVWLEKISGILPPTETIVITTQPPAIAEKPVRIEE